MTEVSVDITNAGADELSTTVKFGVILPAYGFKLPTVDSGSAFYAGSSSNIAS
jgi:hypothetical protein